MPHAARGNPGACGICFKVKEIFQLSDGKLWCVMGIISNYTQDALDYAIAATSSVAVLAWCGRIKGRGRAVGDIFLLWEEEYVAALEKDLW